MRWRRATRIGGDLARLARQLVTETTLLAVAGGGLGIFLAWSLIRALASANLAQLPRGYEIALDPTVIAATIGLTVVVGLMLGVAPAVRLWRMKLDVELREETRGGTSGRRANLIRQALATAQVAIALALLTGAGLLLASFRAVLHLDYGFDPAQVATANVSLPATAYKDDGAGVIREPRPRGPAGDPRRRSGRRDHIGALFEQHQQQRDPRRGLRDEAGRVVAGADAGDRFGRLFRGDAHSARPRPHVRRARHFRRTDDGDDR